jgi:hypothetical protein
MNPGDSIDHRSNEIAGNEEMSNGFDLIRWDYLMQRLDNENLLEDTRVADQPRELQPYAYTIEPTSAYRYHGVSEGASPSFAYATQPIHHVSAPSAPLDTSGMTYMNPRSGETMDSVLKSQSARLHSSSQVEHTGISFNGGGQHLIYTEHVAHGALENNLLVEEPFDLEPIPLAEQSSGPYMAHHLTSLNEALQTFRRFSMTPSVLGSNAVVGSANVESLQATMTPVFPGSKLPIHPMPEYMCKPLSSYNYFYRVERDNIVLGVKNQGDPLPPTVLDFSQRKLETLLHHHWYVHYMFVQSCYREARFPYLRFVNQVRRSNSRKAAA